MIYPLMLLYVKIYNKIIEVWRRIMIEIPKPSSEEVEKYMEKGNGLSNIKLLCFKRLIHLERRSFC